MPLYNFLAPFYDPVLEPIFQPFRVKAMERLPDLKGATVLDLACGTGPNFPLLKKKIADEGRIIGVDLSSGMLRRARRRAARLGRPEIVLIESDATSFVIDPVDCVICTYSLTSMREWKAAFQKSWDYLKPGGFYLIHDIDGQRRNLHTRAVEIATRSHFADKVWEPLERACLDFRMDYIDPSAHLFGGRLFVATGTKPL